MGAAILFAVLASSGVIALAAGTVSRLRPVRVDEPADAELRRRHDDR